MRAQEAKDAVVKNCQFLHSDFSDGVGPVNFTFQQMAPNALFLRWGNALCNVAQVGTMKLHKAKSLEKSKTLQNEVCGSSRGKN